MAALAGLFALILLMPMTLVRETAPHFVVWNVGQGLWTTLVLEQTCWHFDMGGERAPWRNIMQQCRARLNRVHLSHWDWDHISFVSPAFYQLPNMCRTNLPALETTERKKKGVLKVPACADKIPLQSWRPNSPRSTNEASSVVLIRNILLPGDSGKAAEKFWSSELEGLASTRVLVLGHHGSRTATSRELLSRLPNLKMAIASARRRRYGHPHADTLDILKKFAVPVLNTEDWGNIIIWE
jgi:competence protein ComEC